MIFSATYATMNKVKIFTFCFLSFTFAVAQQTRIELGVTETDSMTEKEARLEERRREIELMTLEAQLEAQKRTIQDSLRLRKFFGYRFITKQASETETEQNVFENLPVPKIDESTLALSISPADVSSSIFGKSVSFCKLK